MKSYKLTKEDYDEIKKSLKELEQRSDFNRGYFAGAHFVLAKIKMMVRALQVSGVSQKIKEAEEIEKQERKHKEEEANLRYEERTGHRL